MPRDDFNQKTIQDMGRRVAFLCSNPDCGRHTIGPQAGGDGTVNVGIAAHITAASAGGPRYEFSLSPEERRHISNGIWLCSICAKLIDSDENHFTIELLKRWKKTAEERAFVAIASNLEKLTTQITFEPDDADREQIKALGLPAADNIESVSSRMLVAAKADILAFKNVRGWPSHSIPLNLFAQDDSGTHIVNIEGIASAIAISGELSIVAPPGTGKTTTMVQMTDAIIYSDTTIAALIPLAEWSSTSDRLIQSLTHRNAFQGFSEQHFMLLAYHGKLVLLLDGWNELDPESRKRSIHEINSLRRDYPLLGIVVSTRQEARAIPITGPMIEIKALSEEQQLEIARTLRGKEGEALLDQAWRTPGVRELITIPLYLNALLAYTMSGTMPTTKEEVLNLFVTEHEKSPDSAEILEQELLGVHRNLLVALAVDATQAANTTIQDTRARMIISQTENWLVAEGQITTKPQPPKVIDILVSQHLLIRSGTNSGLSFQHQQFQEWYASFEVERLMLSAAAGKMDSDKELAVSVLDRPAWEESILFTCDRLSRADQTGVNAVAYSVLRTLSIDPMLSAEMIYRSSIEVWDRVKADVITFVERWHKHGTVDRAARFMITTGRPEFAPQIWPLVTNADDQVQFSATRTAHRFRPSVLGPDAQTQIIVLSEKIRINLLVEIAHDSGIDGIEFVTNIAKSDTNTAVKVAVIEALLFRYADRYVADILKTSSDDVWQELSRRNCTDEITDPEISARLRLERRSYIDREKNVLTKIRMLMECDDQDPTVAQLVSTLIESENFPINDKESWWGIERAIKRYPQEISKALINRIQAGHELPFGCEDILRDTPLIDDGVIPTMVTDSVSKNRLVDMATAIVGPNTIGILIGRFLELDDKIQGMEMPISQELRDEHHCLFDRISKSKIESFLRALQSRSDTEEPRRISILADIISRHGMGFEKGPLQADPSLLDPLIGTIHSWIQVMLESPLANRHQFSNVVYAIKRIPKPEFVEGLQRLLAEDLSRWLSARQEYFAHPTRGPLPPDVTHSYANVYQSAFAAIGDEQVYRLMEQYLPDRQFGFDAACVLKIIWDKQHTPEEKKISFSLDFSGVRKRSMQKQQGLLGSSPHAESIFSAIQILTRTGESEADHLHALKLAKVALSMPYGEKGTIINTLLSLPVPTLEKCDFITALALAGETISADAVLDGLRELLEAAKQKTWLLDRQSNYAEQWIQLLPFSDRPLALFDAIALFETRFKDPRDLRWLFVVLGHAPDMQSEQILLDFASRDPRLYGQYEWLTAIIARGTLSSIKILLDLICEGKLTKGQRTIDDWRLSRQLAEMIRNHPGMHTELIHRYEVLPAGAEKSVLERVIFELATPDDLFILIREYAKYHRHFDMGLRQFVEKIGLGKKQLDNYGSEIYEIYSVNTSALRKRLFEMLDDSPDVANMAEACLTTIDELRDEHGRDDSEPRHPNITSGRSWPVVPVIETD